MHSLIVRAAVGPLCDRFGPRLVYVGILLAGMIPTAMAGLVQSGAGVLVIRFFVGILGASFVPCQVWSMQFFDKNVIGTANGLMAGIGNAGGGITYFVMPAIFDSLVKNQRLTPHVAWRVSFIVPAILITAIALGMLFLCEDTPTGKWADRRKMVPGTSGEASPVNTKGVVVELPNDGNLGLAVPTSQDFKSDLDEKQDSSSTIEAPEPGQIEIARAEIVKAPNFKECMRVLFSFQCLLLSLMYACSFGGELAINSILGKYYMKNFHLDQTHSGKWAAMFGLLNVLFRPAGGIISDIIYKATNRSVSAKKFWLLFVIFGQGLFCLLIGLLNSHKKRIMFSLVGGLAFFMDASNGANFAVVPHVFPHANGVLSGFVGASGNLGGVIFAIIFRYHGTHYWKPIWIIGVISVISSVILSWVRMIPKGQIGGR